MGYSILIRIVTVSMHNYVLVIGLWLALTLALTLAFTIRKGLQLG